MCSFLNPGQAGQPLGRGAGIPRGQQVAGLTSQQVWLLVVVDQQAELQHQLWRAAQEGLQQTKHAYICALEQHPPVEVAPQLLPAPAAL